MKKYAVTMCKKGSEHMLNELTVEVEDNEHPRQKAIDLLCELGWMVIRDWVKIVEIKRVYY